MPDVVDAVARRGRAATVALPLVVVVLGLLALLAPRGDAEEPLHRVGALLALGGGLQILHGLRRANAAALRRAITSGVISLLMGLLLLMAPFTPALALFLAGVVIMRAEITSPDNSSTAPVENLLE